MGDRHLVTIPQGVVGDRLPWGGERQGGGGTLLPPPPLSTPAHEAFWIGHHVLCPEYDSATGDAKVVDCISHMGWAFVVFLHRWCTLS